MSFPKSILVPTDFSSKSENAIRYACEIASYSGSYVQFLNVIEEPYDFAVRAGEIVEKIKSENTEKLSKLIDDLHSTDQYRHLKLKGRVLVGKVQSTILSAAEEDNFSLISLGLGGEADLRKAMYGSITNNILLESSVPVLAISKRIDYRPPQKLVFSTDLRESDLKPLKKMKKFAIEIGAALRIVHVWDQDDDRGRTEIEHFGKLVKEKLKAPHQEIEVVENSDFVEGITRYIDNDNHTILVMTRYRRRFFEWLFSNSTVREVAQIASVPLLMLPHIEK